MPTPTSVQRPKVGRLTPGVSVGVRQVNEMATPFTLYGHAWLALALIGAVFFGLRAFGEGAEPDERVRYVEVRAAGRLLAEKAALVDDPDYGPVLRLRDLTEKLPPDLPKLVPVQIYGDHYMPLLPILVKHVTLDYEPGVLEFVGVSYPEGPKKLFAAGAGGKLSEKLPPRPLPVAAAPAIALGHGGLAVDLIGLDAPIALHDFLDAASLPAGDAVTTPATIEDSGWEIVPSEGEAGSVPDRFAIVIDCGRLCGRGG